MIADCIRVRNYRNAEDETVTFSPGINVISGENAQGKTNLLEALYFMSLGRSFRTTHESDVIRFGEDFAVISLDYDSGMRKNNLTVRLFPDRRKQIEKNKVKITKLSDMVGEFRAVLFCPDHLQMIKEGPAMRRNYLDVALSQLRPRYLYSLQNYYKILKQRNALLKSAKDDPRTFRETIGFWSEQLAAEAATITGFRRWYIEKAAENIGAYYVRMGERSDIAEVPALFYQASSHQTPEEIADEGAVKARYLELLSAHHDREIAAGATLYGIHKDDMVVTVNGKDARLYASQGQQRSLVLALKFSEGEICRAETGDYPVYLFDDVLSELDDKRKGFLLHEIRDRQVILTACEPLADGDVHRISVVGGKYRVES